MSKRKRKKISTEIITVDVTQLNHEGRGIAHVNGKATFLLGALASEKVTFQYTKLHRQYDEGTVVDVLKKSNDRITPLCKHFGVCGGCSLQHMNFDAQRLHKQKILLEHFQHQANCIPKIILEPLSANPWEYRRRARLSVRYVLGKNAVLVGFRERSSRYVVHMHQCEILHPSVGKKIKALSELLLSLEMKSHIPQLEIAIGDNATAVVVRHMLALPQSDIEKLIVFSKENHWQLFFQSHKPDSIHPIYPENPSELFYKIPDHKIKIYFKPTQFIQINQAINLKMIARAMELLDLKKTDRVLDLFCGIGNFSLPIAKQVSEVIGVEGSENAILQAKQNALENNIHNTQFFTQDLTTDLTNTIWSKNQFNKILLDPPRVGAKALLPYFAMWKPERIVYISCNLITLARDSKDLLALGYILEKTGVMDMFPHTKHVEAIALFSDQYG